MPKIRLRPVIPLRFAGLLFFLLSLGGLPGLAQFPTQKPAGYVNDIARVLSPAARQQLEDLCKELDEKTKAQLAIVTVQSLEGRPLEEFTVDLATKWGIGPKGSDRGIMLFLAIQDRRSRIEVGYGLEPIIPDGRAGSILRAMTPYLRNGDYNGAMQLAASTIAQIIAQDAGVGLSVRPPPAIATPSVNPPGPVLSDRSLTVLLYSILVGAFGLVIWSVIALVQGIRSFIWPSKETKSKKRGIRSRLAPVLGMLWGTSSLSMLIAGLADNEGAALGISLFFWLFFVLYLISLSKPSRSVGSSGGGWFGDVLGGGGGGGGFGGFGGGSFGGGGASGSW